MEIAVYSEWSQMILQYIIVGIILAFCLGYAGYRLYRTATDRKSACRDCSLKDACTRYGHPSKHHPQGCDSSHTGWPAHNLMGHCFSPSPFLVLSYHESTIDFHRIATDIIWHDSFLSFSVVSPWASWSLGSRASSFPQASSACFYSPSFSGWNG